MANIRCQYQFISPNHYYLTLPGTYCIFTNKTSFLSFSILQSRQAFSTLALLTFQTIFLFWVMSCALQIAASLTKQTMPDTFWEALSFPFENLPTGPQGRCTHKEEILTLIIFRQNILDERSKLETERIEILNCFYKQSQRILGGGIV